VNLLQFHCCAERATRTVDLLTPTADDPHGRLQ